MSTEGTPGSAGDSPEFEVYLRRRTLVPDGDGTSLQPPAALDELILEHARDELAGEARQHTPRWAVPVALAATVLLSLAIVLNVSLNTAREPRTVPADTTANNGANSSAAVSVAAPSRAKPQAVDVASPAAEAKLQMRQSEPAASAAPEQWWRRIQKLRAAGRDREAAAELRQLQARYPRFTPPQEPAMAAPAAAPK